MSDSQLRSVVRSLVPGRGADGCSFGYELRLRGGFSFVFKSPEEFAHAAEQVRARAEATLPTLLEQPFRVEVQAQATFSMYHQVWRAHGRMLKALLTELDASGVTVRVNESGAVRTVVTLTARHDDELAAARRQINEVIKPSVFEVPGKKLLFTRAGREMMGRISDRVTYLHWEVATQTVRIYGSLQQRSDARSELLECLDRLGKMEHDRELLILREKLPSVRQNIAKLAHEAGCEHSWLVGRRLTLSGSGDGVRRLVGALEALGAVLKPAAGHHRPGSVDVCPLCLDAVEAEPHELLCCQHQFCPDCLRPMLAADQPSFPIACPVPGCRTPLAVQDILALATPEALQGLVEASVLAHVRGRGAPEFRLCPTPGCNQLLRRPASMAQRPRAAGSDPGFGRGGRGEFEAFCDACSGHFCLGCTEDLGRPAAAHRDAPCGLREREEQRALDRASREEKAAARLADEIREELNLRCPKCRAPFFDFDGCCALRCARPECNVGFCAICLEAATAETKFDAHPHVRKCPMNPSGKYYMPAEELAAAHRGKRTRMVTELLMRGEPTVRRIALAKLARDLADLDIHISPASVGLPL